MSNSPRVFIAVFLTSNDTGSYTTAGRKSGIARCIATTAYLVAFAANAAVTAIDHKIFLKYIEDPTWYQTFMRIITTKQ